MLDGGLGKLQKRMRGRFGDSVSRNFYRLLFPLRVNG
jgi:hypothetical protein